MDLILIGLAIVSTVLYNIVLTKLIAEIWELRILIEISQTYDLNSELGEFNVTIRDINIGQSHSHETTACASRVSIRHYVVFLSW